MTDRTQLVKNIQLSILALFIFSATATSQINLFTTNGNYPGTNTPIMEMPYKPGLKGSTYLHKDWKKADILLKNDSLKISDIPVRMDIMNNLIEIQHNNEIKVLYAYDTHSIDFEEIGETYITKNTMKNVAYDGFFKLLYNNKSSLLCHYSTKMKEATYNAALNIGDKDKEIVQIENYFLLVRGQVLLKLSKSKKKFRDQFKEEKELYSFIKKNNINPKKEEDLIKFVEFFDSTQS